MSLITESIKPNILKGNSSMNVDLSKQELYVRDIVNAAFVHSRTMNIKTKRVFDREASFFKKHALSLDPKIEKSYEEQKDIVFISGNEEFTNHVVMIFNGELFTTMESLTKMCTKRLKKIEPFVTVSQDEKVNFQLIGATVNLDVSKNKCSNMVVACAKFKSSVKVNNFCVVN